MGPGHVVHRQHRGQVIQRGADRDRDLVGLGVDRGQHVAGVIAQPLGLVVALGREGDRPAELQDHPGHGLAQPGDLGAVLVEVLGDVAGLGITYVHVQHRRPGVVAVHRLLDLLIPGDRDVLREIVGHPHRPIGRAVMINGSWFSGSSDSSVKYIASSSAAGLRCGPAEGWAVGGTPHRTGGRLITPSG